MVFHLAVTICPVPAQRGWTVKIWVPWSQTPSTFVHRSKVWLGTLTAAELSNVFPPPKKTKLRNAGSLGFFIIKKIEILKEASFRFFSFFYLLFYKITAELYVSSNRMQNKILNHKREHTQINE